VLEVAAADGENGLRPSPALASSSPSWQALLQLEEPAGRIVHLTHGQAEAVPEEPEPLVARPGTHHFQVP